MLEGEEKVAGDIKYSARCCCALSKEMKHFKRVVLKNSAWEQPPQRRVRKMVAGDKLRGDLKLLGGGVLGRVGGLRYL